MEEKSSKNVTYRKEFYLTVLNSFKSKTNLTKIQEELGISKQQLNYYIRQLKQNGFLIKKGKGWYEINESSKNVTKYGIDLPKDFIRGHAYVWEIKVPQETKGWNRRIEILTNNNINFKLVGAKLDVPRIKVLGRKIWLCNDHLRIFETKDTSYYGNNAVESKKKAFIGILEVINGLENKLGIKLNLTKIECKKEHYALIKNDLAIEHNQKGVILRISDESGEWLLVDDSLEKGGELENIGKKSLVTNVKMSKWWNENKETNFEVSPKFVLNGFNNLTNNLNQYAENMVTHVDVVRKLGESVQELTNQIKLLQEENKRIRGL